MIYRLEVAGGIAQALPAPVAKQHLRVDHTLDDEYIDALILAAQAQVEEMYLWQSLTPRTYRLSTDGVATEIALPMGPVVSVASVTARTATGAGTVLAESAWRCSRRRSRRRRRRRGPLRRSARPATSGGRSRRRTPRRPRERA
jgi:uncharacterized phiE125 gp8 family phage protein